MTTLDNIRERFDIQPLRYEDVQDFQPQRDQMYEFGETFTPERVAQVSGNGAAWTFWIHGKVEAIGGVAEIWPGRAAAWTFVAENTTGDRRRLLLLSRMFEQVLSWSMEIHQYDRVEATTRVGWARGMRFMACMGFHKEGTMKQYFRGMDYHLFARTQ